MNHFRVIPLFSLVAGFGVHADRIGADRIEVDESGLVRLWTALGDADEQPCRAEIRPPVGRRDLFALDVTILESEWETEATDRLHDDDAFFFNGLGHTRCLALSRDGTLVDFWQDGFEVPGYGVIADEGLGEICRPGTQGTVIARWTAQRNIAAVSFVTRNFGIAACPKEPE